MSTLAVQVVSPLGVIWEGNATRVTVPGIVGEFGVLPGHQPVVSLLRRGAARITCDGQPIVLTVAIDGGFVLVDDNTVTILSDNHARAHPGARS